MLFCTVTALGLVRLVCQPKLMGAAVKTAAEASALLDAFCQQPNLDPLLNLLTLPVRPESELAASSQQILASRPDLERSKSW